MSRQHLVKQIIKIISFAFSFIRGKKNPEAIICSTVKDGRVRVATSHLLELPRISGAIVTESKWKEPTRRILLKIKNNNKLKIAIVIIFLQIFVSFRDFHDFYLSGLACFPCD